MIHLQQPVDSKLCGHTCVAMALGISLEKAVEIIGHRRGTSNREIIKALGRMAQTPRSVRPPKDLLSLQGPAILRIRYKGPRRHHVALFAYGKVYDPLYELPAPTLKDWLDFVALIEARVVSVFPLKFA